MKTSIRIGNSGGFWGDDLQAFKRQLEHGNLDYLTMDFLAEITMSILKKQQMRNPDLGYVTDFVDQVLENAELIKDKKVRILSNAGGMNPEACAKKIQKGLEAKNIALKIAIIEMDSVFHLLDDFTAKGISLSNMETGEDYEAIKGEVQSANAYLGIPPILKALQEGADIIIAGRVTDTSITMAPMVYEFNWSLNDWDKLASGLVAGHIIECGAQSTGGNFTDWHLVEKWDNFGYPIVEVYPDGSFIVEKAENSGGLISIDSIKEQLVYEMGNPAAYISPDVVADFRTIQLESVGPNQVKVAGVKGKPSTQFLKVSMAYRDGYSAFGSIIISGGNAMEKAKKFCDIFWSRIGVDFEKQNTEYVGYNSCHLNLALNIEPNEVLLRLNVYDKDRDKLVLFSKNIAPLILSGPPGVAVTGGRPRVISVMSYWPTLIPKEEVTAVVTSFDLAGEIVSTHYIKSILGSESSDIETGDPAEIAIHPEKKISLNQSGTKIKFKDICLARSGDKGDTANIGIIARSPEIYEYIKVNLTAGEIKNMFSSLCKGKVLRYQMDNIGGLNFLLEASLDGGGTKSLMIDAQGKTFAQAFLNQEVIVPDELLKTI